MSEQNDARIWASAGDRIRKPQLEVVALDYLKFAFKKYVTLHEMRCLETADISVQMDNIGMATVIDIGVRILALEQKPETSTFTTEDAKEADSVEVPATWWDAVKERFLERHGWKVERTRIVTKVVTNKTVTNHVRYYRLCPHHASPTAGRGASQHYSFLKGSNQ